MLVLDEDIEPLNRKDYSTPSFVPSQKWEKTYKLIYQNQMGILYADHGETQTIIFQVWIIFLDHLHVVDDISSCKASAWHQMLRYPDYIYKNRNSTNSKIQNISDKE